MSESVKRYRPCTYFNDLDGKMISGVREAVEGEFVAFSELASLHAGYVEAVRALKEIRDQILPCERMRGTPKYACRWCFAFASDPKGNNILDRLRHLF